MSSQLIPTQEEFDASEKRAYEFVERQLSKKLLAKFKDLPFSEVLYDDLIDATMQALREIEEGK